MVIPMSLLRTASSSACLTVVMDTFFMGFQSEMFWGPVHSGENQVEVGALDVGFKPFTPQGKSEILSFFPSVCFSVRVGLMVTEYLSLSYSLMWVFVLFCFFLICPVCGSHSASIWISFREN